MVPTPAGSLSVLVPRLRRDSGTQDPRRSVRRPRSRLDVPPTQRNNQLMSAVDQTQVRKEWAARGFSCDLWVDPPRRVWNDFVHDTDELVMLVEGEEEFEMNGQKRRLQVGEELLIPAGNYHTARNIGKTTSKWLYGYKRR
jgi:mannose-6-phosphate isomerase-like protein (cupin superfamily)